MGSKKPTPPPRARISDECHRVVLQLDKLLRPQNRQAIDSEIESLDNAVKPLPGRDTVYPDEPKHLPAGAQTLIDVAWWSGFWRGVFAAGLIIATATALSR